MYWIFLIIFTLAVFIPDIVRHDILFLPEEKAEEVAIFLLGAVGFLTVIRNELILMLHKKQKEKDDKRINQTVKDLVESYSYIGEVNRKMDIIMNIALGICDRSYLNKKREHEIYNSITSAAVFLLKADFACLRFVDLANGKTRKEIKPEEKPQIVNNEEILEMEKAKLSIKKTKDYIIVSSPQEVKDIKSYLVIHGYDEEEETNPKNLEILKVFASQAIFLYSYINLEDELEDQETVNIKKPEPVSVGFNKLN